MPFAFSRRCDKVLRPANTGGRLALRSNKLVLEWLEDRIAQRHSAVRIRC